MPHVHRRCRRHVLLIATTTGARPAVALRNYGLAVKIAPSYYCPMTIQTRLKAMRQQDAARILAVSRPYVSQLIAKVRLPSMELAVKAADALGCDDAELGRSCRAWVSGEDGDDHGSPPVGDAEPSADLSEGATDAA